MRSDGRLVIAILSLGTAAFAAQDVADAVEGTVSKVDPGAKTIAIKTRDGSEEILHFAKRTAVHGSKDTDAAGLMLGTPQR